MTTPRDGEDFLRHLIDVDALTAEQRAKLGPLVRQRREALNYSQQELAEAAGIDRKTLGTLESGRRAPHAPKLRAVLEALGIPQAGDVDRKYSERTRSFVVTTAPIFDLLPDELKDEAQHDVVVLLAGKLSRANGTASITSIRNVGGASDTRQSELAAVAKKKSLDRGEDPSDT
jgi:transcriptional regulator with XRE-family HTH domain